MIRRLKNMTAAAAPLNLCTNCPVCIEPYHCLERNPIILFPCGDTLCEICLNSLIQPGTPPQCPFDHKPVLRRAINRILIDPGQEIAQKRKEILAQIKKASEAPSPIGWNREPDRDARFALQQKQFLRARSLLHSQEPLSSLQIEQALSTLEQLGADETTHPSLRTSARFELAVFLWSRSETEGQPPSYKKIFSLLQQVWGDEKNARREERAAARHLLSFLYYEGRGVQKSAVKARELFEETIRDPASLSLHRVFAYYCLAMSYILGEAGLQESLVQGALLLKKAIEEYGQPSPYKLDACLLLSSFYKNGIAKFPISPETQKRLLQYIVKNSSFASDDTLKKAQKELALIHKSLRN